MKLKQQQEWHYKGEISRNKYGCTQIWLACKGCGKERWVLTNDTRLARYRGYCRSCGMKRNRKSPTGNKHPRWNGGITIDANGYVLRWIGSEHIYSNMANAEGYALAHRLMMAAYLGKPLLETEIVHHIDGDRKNNDIENLCLVVSNSAHIKIHHLLGSYKKEAIVC